MANGLIKAAMIAAWLGAPAFADDGTRTERTQPAEPAAEEQRRATEEERLREAPAPTRPAPVRPAPGVQPEPEPGVQPPGEAVPTAETGRRWGLIVFVIAIVALGLLAFRRKPPLPPSR